MSKEQNSDNKSNIIIKKVKKNSGGHHGGAWKVAYADFVTAMMAFFLLLWLLSSAPQEVLKGIADYFSPTIGIKDQKGIGFDGGATDIEDGTKRGKHPSSDILYGAPSKGTIVRKPEIHDDMNITDRNFITVEQALKDAVINDDTLKSFADQILINVTPEGLEILLVDSKDRPMFKPGTSELMPYTKTILEKITRFVKYIPNFISITGYTSGRSFANRNSVFFDPWKLSSERANSARRYIESVGIDPDQIGRIVGKADRELLNVQNPDAPENIRLSILLMKTETTIQKSRRLSMPVS